MRQFSVNENVEDSKSKDKSSFRKALRRQVRFKANRFPVLLNCLLPGAQLAIPHTSYVCGFRLSLCSRSLERKTSASGIS